MKYTYLIVLISLFALGCSKSDKQLLKEIDQLRQSEELGTPEGLKKLAQLQEDYGMRVKDSLGNEHLYQAAMFHCLASDSSKAKVLLNEYITRDDTSAKFRETGFALAGIYSGLGEHEKAVNLLYTVKQRHLPSQKQWADAGILVEEKISKIGADRQDYIELSQIKVALGDAKSAISLLDSAINKYPNYEKRADLMLRAGFLGWELLKNHTVSEAYYGQFLKEYPNHPQVQEIKTIIDKGYLGMTTEQILNSIRNKNK